MVLARLAIVLSLLVLAGCATTGTHKDDPYEDFNRSMYTFNKGLDTYFLKPVAKGYDTVTPAVVSDRISGVFDNIDEVPTLANSLLQWKWGSVGVTFSRFVINSTLGLGGMFDPASAMGLDRRDEDFGQTLAAWGAPQGAYLMLPFLGPSTMRDVWGKPVDGYLSPMQEIDHVRTRNAVRGMDLIDTRKRLLELDPLLEEALDEYVFVRDAYLQRRNYLIHDGNPPLPELEDDCDPIDDDCY